MNAKILLCTAALLAVVLICGCTADTSGQNTAAAAEPPDLIGNWTGTMYGYEDGPGYTDFSGYGITMSVTEQKDRIISGEMIFTNATGYEVWERKPFAAAIDRDGKTFVLVESGDGYASGTIVSSDEIELTYGNGNDPICVAINPLKRS